MRSKVVELEQAVAAVKDGQTILFGDWHGEISAEEVITGVIEKGVKDITAVAVSGGMPDQGVGRMIVAKQVKALKTTHIGLNPVARDQMLAGELDVEFIPQAPLPSASAAAAGASAAASPRPASAPTLRRASRS